MKVKTEEGRFPNPRPPQVSRVPLNIAALFVLFFFSSFFSHWKPWDSLTAKIRRNANSRRRDWTLRLLAATKPHFSLNIYNGTNFTHWKHSKSRSPLKVRANAAFQERAKPRCSGGGALRLAARGKRHSRSLTTPASNRGPSTAPPSGSCTWARGGKSSA